MFDLAAIFTEPSSGNAVFGLCGSVELDLTQGKVTELDDENTPRMRLERLSLWSESVHEVAYNLYAS